MGQQREIETFIQKKGVDRIIPFIVEGTVFAKNQEEECFPPVLSNLSEEQEILGANVQEVGRESAMIKAIAQMLGVKFDALWNRYERAKKRKMLKWAITGALITLSAISAATILAKQKADLESSYHIINVQKDSIQAQKNSLDTTNAILEAKNDSLQDALNLINSQKNVIECSNKQLRTSRDSIALHKNLIENKNKELVEANIQISKANDSIVNQQQMLKHKNLELFTANKQISDSKDSIFAIKLSQDITLANNELLKGYPEMSTLLLNDVCSNYTKMDSIEKIRYKELIDIIDDSLSLKPIKLLSVHDTTFHTSETTLDIIEKSPLLLETNENEYDYIHINDTIISTDIMHMIVNQNKSHVAVYDTESDDNSSIFDIVYDGNKKGIFILSLDSGNMDGFIKCGGWFANMSYPIALGNNAKWLIYREGWREDDQIFYVDFDKKTRVVLKQWKGQEAYSTPGSHGSFSPNDDFFMIRYDDVIDIYSSEKRQIIHSLNYDKNLVDSVYWDKNNLFCISSNDKTYTWNFNNEKSFIYQANYNVQNVAITNDKKLVAAVRSDGQLMVWDNTTNKCLWSDKMMDSPDDLEFTPKNDALWVISGYCELKALDLTNLHTYDIKGGEAEAPHHWPSYIFFINDGEYGITYNTWNHHYNIFNTRKRKFMFSTEFQEDAGFYFLQKENKIGVPQYNETIQLYDINTNKIDKEIEASDQWLKEATYYPSPERINVEMNDNTKKMVTARKNTQDGEIIVEAFSDGTVKVKPSKPSELFSILSSNSK